MQNKRHLLVSKLVGVTFLWLCFNSGFGQQTKPVHLNFNAVFGDQTLVLDSIYKIENENTIKIETLKFYVSGIELIKNNKVVWKENGSSHLYDQSTISSHDLELKVPAKITFDKVKFVLGIDSATNMAGVMGGDLDPTKGMYWTWQSGYINLKLEGKSSLCNNPKKEFQLHIGGYQAPYNTVQTFFLNTGPTDKVQVTLDIRRFIAKADLKIKDHIMSPGHEAAKLSETILECLQVK